MTDKWMDRLSEYVDGELPRADASRLEDHLQGCAECRAVLEDVRGVVARAAALQDREPAVDLWPGIAAQLPTPVTPIAVGRRMAGWRLSLSLPQLVAASLAMLLLGSGAVWMALDRGPTPGPTVTPASTALVPAASPAATYGAAIADLEQVLQEARPALDTSTVRIIEQSLSAIDRAIAEAEAALAEDPASLYLHNHLNTTMQRKLELLNQAAALATAAS